MATDPARYAAILLAAAAAFCPAVAGDSLYVNRPAAVDSADTAFLPAALPPPDTAGSRMKELDRITVSAPRPASRDAAAQTAVIGGEQVRETPRPTPLEALSQESADIYVTSRGGGLHGVAAGSSGGIYIRGIGGFPNTQILVVEDGAPDYQGIFGHPIPDAFFPSLIGRVSVVKGGDGVLYGTNAMGGVVLVNSRWPDSAGAFIENDAAYGSFNTFRDRFTLLYGGRRADLAAAFSAFTTDGHRDGAGGSSAGGKLGVRIYFPRGLVLTVSDKVVFLDGGDPGSVEHPQTDRRFMVLRNNFSARLDKNAGAVSLRIVPWFNAGEHRLYDGFLSRDYTGGAAAEADAGMFGGKITALAGLSAEGVDGEVGNRITGEGQHIKPLYGGALYCQLTLFPGAPVTAVGGGRLHYGNRYGIIPLYKAGIQWKIPGDAVTLSSRLANNFRQPTIRELYLPFPAANPGLRPERALNWDAGASFCLGRWKVHCTVYRTRVDDLIKYFGVWPSAEVVNIDHVEIWGIDADIEIARLGPFALFAGACRQDVGRFTKQNPDTKVNARLDFGADLRPGRLECSLSGEWVSGLYMSNYGRDPMPDLFFVDASVRLRSRWKGSVRVEPYLIVRNCLDVPYSIFGRVFDVRYEYIQYYPMPGINALAGLSIRI